MTPFRGSNQEQQSYILHSRIVALYESEMLSICQKRSPLAFHTSTESIHSSIRLISEFTIRASDSRLRIIESMKIQTNERITETSSRKNTWHIHQKHQNLIWKLALTQCKKTWNSAVQTSHQLTDEPPWFFFSNFLWVFNLSKTIPVGHFTLFCSSSSFTHIQTWTVNADPVRSIWKQTFNTNIL